MIQVKGLCKRYNGLNAVDDLSFEVGGGEVFGFIGPNGAGKTTTIRILATLLEPSSGEATVCGYDVVNQPEQVRRVVGYMPDAFGVYEGVAVWEYLDFFAAAFKVPSARRPDVVEKVMDLTDLAGIRNRTVNALSKGMRQRLCLAKTLVHDPAVLVLDEPASGLDPRARIEIRALLKELALMGKTVFISSHILTELTDLVDKVGIIERGRMLAFGTPEEIVNEGRARRLTLRVEFLGREAAARARPVAAAHSRVAKVRQDGAALVCDFDAGPEEIRTLLAELTAAELPITGLHHDRHSLEDVFLQVTRGELQ